MVRPGISVVLLCYVDHHAGTRLQRSSRDTYKESFIVKNNKMRSYLLRGLGIGYDGVNWAQSTSGGGAITTERGEFEVAFPISDARTAVKTGSI